jgi:hypothetical protein
VVVGCGASKLEIEEGEQVAACALHTGDLFRKSLAIARTLAPDTDSVAVAMESARTERQGNGAVSRRVPPTC